jgi:hypothetical protein
MAPIKSIIKPIKITEFINTNPYTFTYAHLKIFFLQLVIDNSITAIDVFIKQKRGGSLRLMYYHVYMSSILVFQSKELQTETSIIFLDSLFNIYYVIRLN